MTPPLAERKRIELEQKLVELETEFADWLRMSGSGAPFERHYTQIRAITSGLREFAAGIQGELDAARQPEEILSAARNIQSLILAVRRMWEYFRSKWVQRRDDKFRDYLRAADELAWSFYEPVLRHLCPAPVSPCRREPPLVFLNGGISPFAVSRGKAFQAEQVIGEGFPEDRRLRQYLRQIPISVIGVPWFQVCHLPDALVLAHETGHTVEADFSLHDELDRKFSAISPAWQAWQREVFADLYGCLVMGPPFLGTLIDFLAVDRVTVATEFRSAPEWNDYPTAALRILLCAAALKELGFESESAVLKAYWTVEFPRHALSAYEKQFDAVIADTLTKPLSSLNAAFAAIPDLRFTRDHLTEANATAESLGNGSIPDTSSIRVLFAGMRVLFESNPAATLASEVNRNPAALLLKRFDQIAQPGTRDSEEALDQGQLDALSKQSKVWGRMLFEQRHDQV